MAKDDLLLVRKDISMPKMFNLAFMSAILALLFARVFYVVSNPSSVFNSVLGFLAFTYYNGLSLIGGIAGGLFFTAIYSQYKRYPVGRITDLFTVSLIGVLPVGFVLQFILQLGKTSLAFNILAILVFVLSFIFVKGVYKLSERGEIKDGSFSLIFMVIFSLSYFIIQLFSNLEKFSFLKVENLLTFLVIFISIILLLNQEVMNKFLNKK